jgi:predicted secreted hydrolase
MRSSLLKAVVMLPCAFALVAQSPYRMALPGYRYEFPRDYFNHPEFQTEWWYYTGNVAASDGHRFGFELTFFRQGVNRESENRGTWDVQNLYPAHLALGDLDGKVFYHSERTNRSGPGIAGVDEKEGRIWNGNWKITWKDGDQFLEAVDERFSMNLMLHPEKPPVIHGENGISQKSEGPGHASHYFSLTRLKTTGKIQLNGRSFTVSGLSWMDHEFFTHQLEDGQVGWDWFSLQLNDDTELMLFRIRRKDSSVDPYSSGTYIDSSGHSLHLSRQDFSLAPEAGSWKSPISQAVYPVRWRVSVPKLQIEVEATTLLKSQELSGPSQLIPTYWEGAIDVNGHKGGATLTGSGYLEMTGYDKALGAGR